MEKMKPIVSRHWLSALAGIMWTGVGIMLMWRAQGWLAVMEKSWAWGLAAVGVIIAITFYTFMFTKTVAKNIRRLCSLPDPVGLLAFNSPKSYFLIILMISMGIALRHSALDRRILAAVYAGMGGALFLASLHFYRHFYDVKVLQKPCHPDEDGA